MVAFDLETTGVDTEEDRIVTAAVARVGGGEETRTETWLVNPGIPIPEEAAAVHGITDDVAYANGREPAEAVAEVLEALCGRGGGPLVAFNARFDLTVLDREARRYGLVPLSERVEPLYVVDPLVIDKWLHRFRKGSRRLDAICAHYGATLEGAHDASFDAIAAARTAWVLGAKGKVTREPRTWGGHYEADCREREVLEAEWERVRYELPLLHEAQRLWAMEQAAGLRDYFRGKGQLEDAAGVQPEWPVVPAP